jgi:hypothetical protein
MTRLPRRLDEIESTGPYALAHYLRAAGLPPERVTELMRRGEDPLDVLDRLTDDEEAAVREHTARRWGVDRVEDLTDDQLRRIANGEDPRRVCTP